jgi:hypothetical protein
MRNFAVGMLLAAVAGSAGAADDSVAQAFYRLDFGTARDTSQSVGLRLDDGSVASRMAPALLEATFSGHAAPVLRLQGAPIAGPALAAGAARDGGWFSSLSAMQIGALIFTAGVFTVVIADAADSGTKPTEALDGSGGN